MVSQRAMQRPTDGGATDYASSQRVRAAQAAYQERLGRQRDDLVRREMALNELRMGLAAQRAQAEAEIGQRGQALGVAGVRAQNPNLVPAFQGGGEFEGGNTTGPGPGSFPGQLIQWNGSWLMWNGSGWILQSLGTNTPPENPTAASMNVQPSATPLWQQTAPSAPATQMPPRATTMSQNAPSASGTGQTTTPPTQRQPARLVPEPAARLVEPSPGEHADLPEPLPGSAQPSGPLPSGGLGAGPLSTSALSQMQAADQEAAQGPPHQGVIPEWQTFLGANPQWNWQTYVYGTPPASPLPGSEQPTGPLPAAAAAARPKPKPVGEGESFAYERPGLRYGGSARDKARSRGRGMVQVRGLAGGTPIDAVLGEGPDATGHRAELVITGPLPPGQGRFNVEYAEGPTGYDAPEGVRARVFPVQAQNESLARTFDPVSGEPLSEEGPGEYAMMGGQGGPMMHMGADSAGSMVPGVAFGGDSARGFGLPSSPISGGQGLGQGQLSAHTLDAGGLAPPLPPLTSYAGTSPLPAFGFVGTTGLGPSLLGTVDASKLTLVDIADMSDAERQRISQILVAQGHPEGLAGVVARLRRTAPTPASGNVYA